MKVNTEEIKYDKLNKTKKERRFFDAFSYNGESKMLLLRLSTLDSYIDKFIIFMSPISYSGIPRNLSFFPLEKEIEKYKDKIEIVREDVDSKNYKYASKKNRNKYWGRENAERDGLMIGIERQNPNINDIIILSDLDEIPTKEAMELIIKDPPTTYSVLKGDYYMYNYCYRTNEKWNMCVVFPYKGSSTKQLNSLRNKAYKKSLPIYHPEKTLFHHCTYCFSEISEFQNKFRTFAHKEFSTPQYTSAKRIYLAQKCRLRIVFDPIKLIYDPVFAPDTKMPHSSLNFLVNPNFTLSYENSSLYEDVQCNDTSILNS